MERHFFLKKLQIDLNLFHSHTSNTVSTLIKDMRQSVLTVLFTGIERKFEINLDFHPEKWYNIVY